MSESVLLSKKHKKRIIYIEIIFFTSIEEVKNSSKVLKISNKKKIFNLERVKLIGLINGPVQNIESNAFYGKMDCLKYYNIEFTFKFYKILFMKLYFHSSFLYLLARTYIFICIRFAI